MEQMIRLAIEEVRPYLQSEGGDCSILGIDLENKIVTLQLEGACDGCSMSSFTLKMGIENYLKEAIDEEITVEA